MPQLLRLEQFREHPIWLKAIFGGILLSAMAACSDTSLDESAYVLIHQNTLLPEEVGVRAYLWGEEASPNGGACREVVQLANETVDSRKPRGETHLVKYECVSLAEAKARGVK